MKTKVKKPGAWAKAKLVRYADDFVVLAYYIGPRISGWIESKLEGWMRLELNRDKTRVVNLCEEGKRLDFLGYAFRFDRDLRGRDQKYLNVFPSEKALLRERDRLREMTSARKCYKPIPMLIEEINERLRGWSNYISYGYPAKSFIRSTGT
jgi:RNA-directed DNA polymerase